MTDNATRDRTWAAAEPNFLKQAETQLSELMLSLDYLGDPTLIEIFDDAESKFNERARALRFDETIQRERT